MVFRVKLNKEDYDRAKSEWTAAKAKEVIDGLIQKHKGKNYNSKNGMLALDNRLWAYKKGKTPNLKLSTKVFLMTHEVDKESAKKARVANIRARKEARAQQERKNYELITSTKKLQQWYRDSIKQDISLRKTGKLANRDGVITMENIKSVGMKGLLKIFLTKSILEKAIEEHQGLKVWVDTTFIVENGKEEESEFYLRSRPYEIHTASELDTDLAKMVQDIEIQAHNKQLHKSGLKFKKVDRLAVHYGKFVPMKASKYIELPKNIKNTKGCINIKNTDDQCFKWSIYCVVKNIMEKDHPERMFHYSKYKKDSDGINWEGVAFPVSVGQGINTFEELNPTISVNVYELKDASVGDNKIVKPLRITKRTNAEHHCNLLYIENEEGSHYVVIRDLNRLCFSQYSKSGMKCHICPYCLHNYARKESWENSACSKKMCISGEDNGVYVMPEPGAFVSFTNEKDDLKQLLCPFTIILDFEAFNKQMDSKPMKGEKTVKHTVHEPNSYCLYVISTFDHIKFEPVLYRGPDCIEHLFKTLKELEYKFMKHISFDIGMKLTPEEEETYKNTTQCHICEGRKGEGFCSDYKHANYKKQRKVRDHCHFTGKFRGAAHGGCNLAFNYQHLKIPVFCHNMKGYDSHFIISKADEFDCRNISCIALNSEKFLSFSFDKFEFKDSMAFMNTSLEKLVELNKASNKPVRELFKHTVKGASKYIVSDIDLDYLTSKGIYPYSYMNSHDRFNETELPPKKAFHNDLKDEPIAKEDYDHAKAVWDRFECHNLGDYHDLYLLTDVLLLADVFSVFRDMCMEYYGLDCFQYLTLSHYAWNAMLKMTKDEDGRNIALDLITDLEMYDMIEKGKRGGMVQVSKRFVEANNPHMKEYDPSKETSYVEYVDANNLYGWAMSQKLPHKDFTWYEQKLTEEDIRKYNDEDDTGYFVECDLHYPEALHDEHCDYPLAPERMCIKEAMLSEYSKARYSHVYGKEAVDEKVEKLILNLHDKDKYVLHIRNLKFYLEQGLVLKQVYRVVKFKQSAWLKPYIDFNTEKRKIAKKNKNKFEQDLFKLMNNAVFGKTMEDVKQRVNFELVKDGKRYDKVMNDPALKSWHQISDGLVGFARGKREIKLNKPIQIGVAVLDLSKLHMYKFYYNVLKPRYKNNLQLCYTDTDSLIIHVKTEDIYRDMYDMKEHFDLSGLDRQHPYYDTSNEKVLGKFSLEAEGKIIEAFCGPKAKMYVLKLAEGKEKAAAKGCPEAAAKKQFNFEKYRQTVMEGSKTDISFTCIRNKNHRLYTMGINKVGLTEYDNKRYYLDTNNSRPYGHYLNA